MREKLNCGGELTVEKSCLQRRLTAEESYDSRKVTVLKNEIES